MKHIAGQWVTKVCRTAALHIVGSIDPVPPVVLASVFYPTSYPPSQHPTIGLVASEKRALSEAAHRFKNHEQYENDHATLMDRGQNEAGD